MNTDEDFVCSAAEREAQVVAYRAGRGERVPSPQLLAQGASRELEHRGELRCLGRPESLDAAQVGDLGAEQAGEALEAPDQLARKLHGALATDAWAQAHGHQLGVGQSSRTLCQQPLARPFLRRPVSDAQGDASEIPLECLYH